MRRLATLALPLLLLAACGDGDQSASPAATTAPPVTTAPSGSVPPTAGIATPSGGAGCPLLQVPSAGTTVVPITIKGKKASTPEHTVSVKLGSLVRLEVNADTVDEVHVHTYDDKVDTIPGCLVALEFEADIPGTVEVELEKAGIHLVEIKAS